MNAKQSSGLSSVLDQVTEGSTAPDARHNAAFMENAPVREDNHLSQSDSRQCALILLPCPPRKGLNSTSATARNPAMGSRKNLLALSLVAIAAPLLNAAPWLGEGYTWVGWIGLCISLIVSTSHTVLAGFAAQWLSGCMMMAVAFHWSPTALAYTISSDYWLGLLVAIPLIMWEGLRFSLGFWLASRITQDVRKSWFAVAVCSIFLEYLMPGVFGWKVGYIQLALPWTSQAIDIFGPSYATLIAIAYAGALHNVLHWIFGAASLSAGTLRCEAGQSRPAPAQSDRTLVRFLVLAPLILLILDLVYGFSVRTNWSRHLANVTNLKVGLVQVDPSFVDSLDNAQRLTEELGNDVDLVCWPESSGGTYDLQLADLRDEEQNFRMSRDPERGLRPWPRPTRELLVGGKNYRGVGEVPEHLHVTAMLLDTNEQLVGRYHKRFLMPFGEYVPAEKYVPGLSALFDLDERIEPGISANYLASRTGAKIGAMLCYEDMVPRAAREMVNAGANVLVSLINGSAFTSRTTLYQHRLLAQSRAIECRRYLMRCAATGETCVISPMGEVVASLPLQENGSLKCSVALIDSNSIYSRFPYLFPILGTLLGVVWLVQFTLYGPQNVCRAQETT